MSALVERSSAAPTRMYEVALTPDEVVMVLRRAGIVEAAMPRFIESYSRVSGEPTFFEQRGDELRLWQPPRHGDDPPFLPLRLVPTQRGTRIEVGRTRMRPALRTGLAALACAIIVSAVSTPLIVPMFALLVAVTWWGHHRGTKARVLEKLVHACLTPHQVVSERGPFRDPAVSELAASRRR